MGTVFHGRAPDGRDVAIKILHRAEPGDLARFQREARLLASLGEADGFVPLLDQGTAPQGAYLVMPFLAGGTLRAMLQARRCLGAEETLRLGLALARALGRAHASGIVHRDVKPENVLLDARGAPFVADLGLAKYFAGSGHGTSQSLSLSGAFRGTAGYMPLEQCRDAKSVGPEADVFALGALLYECLSGAPAFSAENLVGLISRIESGSYERLSRAGVEGELVRVIDRCLATEPSRRFADGAAVARALEAAALGPRGAPRAVVALVALAVLAAGGLAAFAVAARAPPRPKAVPLPPPPPPRVPLGAEVPSYVERGLSLESHGDHEGAIAQYRKALALDPRSASAWDGLGSAHGNQGQLELAVEELTKAIELDPGSSRSHVNRGLARGKTGDAAGELADLDRAIALDAKNAWAYYNRGSARSDAGDFTGALSDFDLAVTLEPGQVEAWCNRGETRKHLGDRAGALADYSEAIARAPDLAVAWCNRGAIKLDAKDTDGGIADLTRAIELDPGLTVAYRSRSIGYIRRGDNAAATQDLKRVVALDPSGPLGRDARETLAKLGQ
jgi:tetratricopeptide (TPR) repeat protein